MMSQFHRSTLFSTLFAIALFVVAVVVAYVIWQPPTGPIHTVYLP